MSTPKKKKTAGLDDLRVKIDAIDVKLLKLLNDRARLVLQVGQKKERKGVRLGSVAFVPHRERQILDRLAKQNPGPFPNEALAAVFREIMSASLAMEGKPRIAYMGPRATHTHMAAVSKFGSQCEYIPVGGVKATFTDVEQGRADYGVVPIENSTEGVINHTLDLMVDSDLKICSELSVPIRHMLLCKSGKLSDISSVLSHPQALAQTRGWLDEHLPGVRKVETPSTSQASQKAAKDKTVAAVGSELGAEIYGLKIAAKNIQDISDNRTRFLVIGRTISKATGKDKTSVMLSIRDKVGALADILKPFEKHKVNLSSIESRPSRRKAWDYYFFIDFAGHQDSPRVKKLLADLERRAANLKVLGSYPSA